MRGQSVGSSTLAQQRDIAERRSAIDLLALSHVGDRLEQPTITIFGLDLEMAIPRPGTPSVEFRRIKSRRVMR